LHCFKGAALQQNLPEEIIFEAKEHFTPSLITRARTFVEDSRITISFQKVKSSHDFIVSALVQDNAQHATRITFRKNAEEPLYISSSCDCNEWTKENYCSHVVSLYLKEKQLQFIKLQYQSKASDGSVEGETQSLISAGLGVHAKKYGTIIEHPYDLVGAGRNTTYASLQYVLANQKIVVFPFPHNFEGKIVLNLHKLQVQDDLLILAQHRSNYIPQIIYINANGDRKEKVSLFEYLYLFDWETGIAYNLPDDIKDFIKKIKHHYYSLPVDDYLRIAQKLIDKNWIEINIDGEPLEFIEMTAKPIFSIKSSDRKNFLDLNLNFLDPENQLVILPSPMKLLAWNHGMLEDFKSRGEAIDFLNKLLATLKDEHQDYRKYLYNHRNKDMLIEWVEALKSQDYLKLYLGRENKVINYSTPLLRGIITGMIECFGSISAKNSGLEKDDKELFWQVPKNAIFEGINQFYDLMNSLNIDIMYNSKKVRSWSGSIRFERQNAGLDWFDLSLSMSQSDLKIIQGSNLEENYVMNEDGLILLTKEQKELIRFMQRYTKVEKSGESKSADDMVRFGLSMGRARIFELFELRKLGIEGALTEQEIQFCNHLANMTEMPTYPIDAKFVKIARSYQITGYQWLRFLYENKFGACLADDMGLGKTLQTIMFIHSILDKVNRILIVCPVSILLNWQKEIERFAGFPVQVYYGDDRDQIDVTQASGAKVVLTSYGIMKKESFSKLGEENFDILIFDEVQNLKNIRSLGAISARNLKAQFRICLTGTPVENDISEFYNIIDLAIPGVWGDLSLIRSTANSNRRLIARNIAKPFILRRTKKQVLTELPDKEEQYIYLEFDPEEKLKYAAKLESIRKKITEQTVRHRYGEILKGLLELRQLCLWQEHHSSKVEFLVENLLQIVEEGNKALVFSQFTTYLDRIQLRLKKHNIEICRIDGTQTMKKRQAQVDEFQNGKTQVFLISLKAGGVGLNLTAANYIFLMDPWWNPAVENQAIDRAHRIGQENKLTVYRPIIKGSVEEKVLELQNNKRELFQALLEDQTGSDFSGKLSMDDFKSILGLE
jgi:superfamily II DNA or RNA helicase